MSKQRYSKELREEIVQLVHEGHSVQSLARSYEPSAATIHNWVSTARSEMHDRELASLDETARLCASVRQLEPDNAILKKAAAWFPKERL